MRLGVCLGRARRWAPRSETSVGSSSPQLGKPTAKRPARTHRNAHTTEALLTTQYGGGAEDQICEVRAPLSLTSGSLGSACGLASRLGARGRSMATANPDPERALLGERYMLDRAVIDCASGA